MQTLREPMSWSGLHPPPPGQSLLVSQIWLHTMGRPGMGKMPAQTNPRWHSVSNVRRKTP